MKHGWQLDAMELSYFGDSRAYHREIRRLGPVTYSTLYFLLKLPFEGVAH